MTGFMKAKALSFVAAAVVGFAVASPALAGPNLVSNGGFETGPGFPGWTQFGADTSLDSQECNQSFYPVSEGSCSGAFGAQNDTSGISQLIALNAGDYIVQFDVAFAQSSGPKDSFLAEFDGQILTSLTDEPEQPYVHYSFIINSASAHNAELRFTFRNDPSFVVLDAVSVQTPDVQAPEPASLALLGLGLAGLGFSRRKLKN